MSKLPKRHFWEWFKLHQQEYRLLFKKPKKEMAYWVRELNTHLRAYYKFLGFSLECPQEGTARLIITVSGKSLHFKRVEAFVATAPAIPGWNIQAFDEPKPVDFLLDRQMEEAGIDPRECYFSLSNDELETITVYHPLCTHNNKRLFLELAYSAVYNLLGEHTFGLQVGAVEVDNLSFADPSEVYPLEELPTHIGWRPSSMVVDENGLLK